MSGEPMTRVVDVLRDRLAGPADDDLPDADLLGRYLAGRDEAAFAALVRRHGPLVWASAGGCSATTRTPRTPSRPRSSSSPGRPAGSGRRGSVAGWLHGVALRVAQKALVRAARQRKRDGGPGRCRTTTRSTDVDWADVRPVLDEELDRLGDKYRAPVALCLIEGKSHEEAARRPRVAAGDGQRPAGPGQGAAPRPAGPPRRDLPGRRARRPCWRRTGPRRSRPGSSRPRSGRPERTPAAVAELARGVTGVRLARWKLAAASRPPWASGPCWS